MFAEIRPATTLVQVCRLIDDRAMIEIEADAIVEESAQLRGMDVWPVRSRLEPIARGRDAHATHVRRHSQ